jgi:hypothetical protein
MPKVLNKSTATLAELADAVYVGRPTKWGNHFRAPFDGPRGEVVAKHRKWFLGQEHMVAKAKRELRGKNLICWCAPAECHADILLKVANEDDDDPQ